MTVWYFKFKKSVFCHDYIPGKYTTKGCLNMKKKKV